MSTPDLTVAISAFLLSRQAQGCTPTTLANYHAFLDPFALAHSTDWTTPEAIEAFLVSYRNRNAAPSTVHTAWRRLRAFYAFAVRRNYLDADPTNFVAEPHLPARAPKAIGHANAARIIHHAAEHLDDWQHIRDLALIVLAYDTGLRCSELAALHLADLDMTERLISVRSGKGDKDRITVFTAATAAVLAAWIAARPTSPLPHLFIGKQGRLTRSGIYKIFKRAAAAAGISGRTNPHAYRHELARQTLMRGGNLKHLAEQLGHANIDTTARAYAVFLVTERRQRHDQTSPLQGIEI